MAENRMFRNAFFGGFNKDDVNEYIKTLENEIEAIKVLHQKEKNDLLRQIDQREEDRSEKNMQVPKLQEELASMRAELETVRFAKGDAERELAAVRSELDSVKTELETSRQKQASQPAGGMDSDSAVSAERERLRAKEEELERREKELEGKGFVDYDTISAVLKDARNTAAVIEQDARKKADEIREGARQDAEKYKKEQEARLSAELESKGIQLFAAKHKINQCANAVKRIQENLFDIYVGMDRMASNMPDRLDHYWSGEAYKELTELENEEDGDKEGKADGRGAGEKPEGEQQETEEHRQPSEENR